MEKENLDFKAALRWFAQNFGLDVSHQGSRQSDWVSSTSVSETLSLLAERELKATFPPDSQLNEWLVLNCPEVSSTTGVKYLSSHGIPLEFAKRCNLREIDRPGDLLDRLVAEWGSDRVCRSGLAWGRSGRPRQLIWNDSALLFPFYEDGEVTYLQARMFAGARKYLNPHGIAKPMFNSDRLSKLAAGAVVHICEGVPDALAMEAHDMPAVGVLGATSFRPEWADRFLKFDVVVLGHGDLAGEKFVENISSLFRTRGKSVLCKPLPKGKDAADVLGAGLVI